MIDWLKRSYPVSSSDPLPFYHSRAGWFRQQWLPSWLPPHVQYTLFNDTHGMPGICPTLWQSHVLATTTGQRLEAKHSYAQAEQIVLQDNHFIHHSLYYYMVPSKDEVQELHKLHKALHDLARK